MDAHNFSLAIAGIMYLIFVGATFCLSVKCTNLQTEKRNLITELEMWRRKTYNTVRELEELKKKHYEQRNT